MVGRCHFTERDALCLFRANGCPPFYRTRRPLPFLGKWVPAILPYETPFAFFGQMGARHFTVRDALCLFWANGCPPFYRRRSALPFTGKWVPAILPNETRSAFFRKMGARHFTVGEAFCLLRANGCPPFYRTRRPLPFSGKWEPILT
ncbi:MAG: hypothetical protein K0Q87_3951 [Neobacillus sp.]|jgi:hypothetical protein|nr:hypothetical protein [Neobacillus sp.]